MNKTALGFGIGLIIIAVAAGGYLLVNGSTPQPAAPVETAAAPKAETPDAAPAPQPAPAPVTQPELPKIDQEPPRIPQPPRAKPTRLSLTRTIPDAAAFADVETLNVLIRIEQIDGNDPVRAMGMQEQIPKGFTLEGFDGARQPEVKPPAGHSGVLEFAWIQFPEDFFPAEFSYRLKKSGETETSPQISGQVLFRTSGEELRTGVVNSLLGTGAEAVAQSDDVPATAKETAAAMAAQAADPAVALDAADEPAASPPVSTTANLFLARGPKSPQYKPGEAVEFDVLIEKEGDGTVSAVALVDTVPPGWTFDSVTAGSTEPPIKPAVGAGGNLSFIFIQVPDFPVTFSYKLIPPADAQGEQQIRGKVVYRVDNNPFEGMELVSTLSAS